MPSPVARASVAPTNSDSTAMDQARTTHFHVRVPGSTANIGVGFDVVGAALSLYLHVDVAVSVTTKSIAESDAIATDEEAVGDAEWSGMITVEHSNDGMAAVEGDMAAVEGNMTAVDDGQGMTLPPLDHRNLIVQSALHMLHRRQYGRHRYNGQYVTTLPQYTSDDVRQLLGNSVRRLHLCTRNGIPLSRGLGSSAAAIVAGIVIGNELCAVLGVGERAGHDDLLDVILELENHPDNVSACLFGGLTVSYMRSEEERRQVDGRESTPIFTRHACGYARLRVHPAIRAVCVVPQFELSTKLARQALPQTYSRADTIYSMQRLAVLLTSGVTVSEEEYHRGGIAIRCACVS